MAEKCKISTPFTQGAGSVPGKESAGGTYNHNPISEFSKPRDGGVNLPIMFASTLSGTPLKIESPFKEGVQKK